MGQLADRIAALQLPLNAPQSVTDELAAIAAQIVVVEQENKLLRKIVEATGDVPRRRHPELDEAVDALDDWRESHEVPHG